MKKISLMLFTICCAVALQAQTADEIVENYLENIGGADNWASVESFRMESSVNSGGLEIPLEIIQTSEGKQFIKIELQGKEVVQLAFDGESAWSHNFMTMEAELMESEQLENLKRESKDIPDPFLDYKKKGYTIELMGKEEVEGTECFKIKLTKTPLLVDGAEEENVVYYYFDTENFVPIISEQEIKQGPSKGNMAQAVFSDYQEVEGLYFPFSVTNRLKGGEGQAVNFTKIELNPELDASMWNFPEKEESDEDAASE